MSVPAKELKIPGRLSDLIVHLFEAEGIDCSYSKGKITLGDITSSALWARCKELLSGIDSLSVEDARRLLRGAFWSSGYCSDPVKS